jgi:TonB family protein
MFDTMIESKKAGASGRRRSRYFAVSASLITILFLSAVLASIYAADIDIGYSDMDLARLVAPNVATAPEPVRPEQRSPRKEDRTDANILKPTRVMSIQRIDEIPNKILPVSNVPSKYRERPLGSYEIGKIDIGGPGTPEGIPDGSGNTRTDGTGLGDGPGNLVAKTEKAVPPPPVVKPESAKPVVVSLGVVNGKATNLPQPAYPASVIAMGVGGVVNVQITISEEGSVISAKAVNGHPILKRAAEDAARRAKFTPTYLSKKAVKATGLIAYNFKRN